MLFSDNSFIVTRNRFITPGQTYSIRNITSVSNRVKRPYISKFIISVVGVFILLCPIAAVFIVPLPLTIILIVFVIFAAVGLFMWVKSLVPVYTVRLITSAGEFSALKGEDKEVTDQIVAALNKAIAQH